MISSFRGEHSFLSNFYACSVEFEGLVYPSAEHAYQAAKTLDPAIRECIRACQSPSIAKRLGRQFPLREDWEALKVYLMRCILRAKFSDPTLGMLLLATGYEVLEEGNWWGDTTWGVYRGVGQNLLGKLLMDIRSELRNELG